MTATVVYRENDKSLVVPKSGKCRAALQVAALLQQFKQVCDNAFHADMALRAGVVAKAGVEGSAAPEMAEGSTAGAASQQDGAEQSEGRGPSSMELVPATPEEPPETPSQPAHMPMSEEMRDHIQVSTSLCNTSICQQLLTCHVLMLAPSASSPYPQLLPSHDK